MARQNHSFPNEFKREAAGLVLDQGYSIAGAALAVDIGASPIKR
jgi:transposase